MKISPKTEQWLSNAYDDSSEFFSRVEDIIRKIVRAFFWVYLLVVTVWWSLQLFGEVIYHSTDSLTLLWLFLTSLGLVALYSYLNEIYIGHTHFWKVWLILTFVAYFRVLSFLEIPVILLMWPTIYALYKLGFDDQGHSLFCLIKRVNVAKLDKGLYDMEMSLPPGSKRIDDLEIWRFVIGTLKIIPPFPRSQKPQESS